MRYVAGGKTHSVHGIVDPSHLEIRRLPNGSHLLKSGPTMGTYRALGNGECGGCETAAVAIYHLSPASGITVALRAGLNTDRPSNNDGDIVVAPDWQSGTAFPEWSMKHAATVTPLPRPASPDPVDDGEALT